MHVMHETCRRISVASLSYCFDGLCKSRTGENIHDVEGHSLLFCFPSSQSQKLCFGFFLTNLLSMWTTGARREVWLAKVLGRPDFRAEEEEHDKGFRREPVVGRSYA